METIRKDLMFLEEKGVAQKEYGGASLSQLGVEKNLEFRKYHEDGKTRDIQPEEVYDNVNLPDKLIEFQQQMKGNNLV